MGFQDGVSASDSLFSLLRNDSSPLGDNFNRSTSQMLRSAALSSVDVLVAMSLYCGTPRVGPHLHYAQRRGETNA